MNILLTNDDGFDSEGIRTLYEVLKKNHNVYILAPSGNRSAFSHKISMSEELEILQIADKIYSCSGSPADCSFIAVRTEIFPVNFDCVISGINHGPNLGTDTVYSGTCAAARESSLLGIPGLAVSLEFFNGKIEYFLPVAEFIEKNLVKLLDLIKNSSVKSFVNINALSISKYKGAKISKFLSIREYDDKVNVAKIEGGFKTSNRFGNLTTQSFADSDENLIKQEFISISLIPCQVECVNIVENVEFSV